MDGRRARPTSTEALPFDVIDLTPTTVVAYRQPASPDRPSSDQHRCRPACASPSRPVTRCKVRIFERYGGNIFPTIQGQSADLGIQRVAEDGTIKIPCVGVVQVAGLDLNQIEQRIIQQLGNKVQEPEVIVEFEFAAHPYRDGVGRREEARARVDARRHPHASSTPSTWQAGRSVASQLAPANQLEVVVRRNGQVILTAQFSDLLAGGDIPVQKGDEIVVRPNPRVLHRAGRGPEARATSR